MFTILLVKGMLAQEGLAPLWGNEKLFWETEKEMVAKSERKTANSSAVGDDYSYQFKLDTNHLPIMDDFSKNLFKSYVFDTANTVTDTLVWQSFLKDGVYVERFDAMNDTSYHFTFDAVASVWDSVANPVVYITHLSQTDYQVVIATDTVWAWDTIIVGNTVVTNHLADVNYVNFSDTVVVVPDVGYSVWGNNNVLHNYTYSDEPITLGMATFDGLDSTGTPYDPTFNPNSYQIADILESKPIFLKTRPNGAADYNPLLDTSIYLSFFYQPQGLGDAPEVNDSLVLEFFTPINNSWTHVWSVAGSPVHPFKAVIVPIKNAKYFLDGFKFRFKNYASVSGNFDHWNIDYVRIAEKRTPADTTIKDVGLMDPGYSLLKEYYQMPWEHFKNDAANLMRTEQMIRYRNVGTTNYIALSTFHAYDNGSLLFSASVGLDPQFGPLAIGSKKSTFTDVYPITSTDTVKSFNVTYLAEVNPDLNHNNDTAFFHQQFGSQYAYDDGSAESAYFVTSSGAQIAVEYKLAKRDSLRAVNIYFPKSYESILDRPYRLMVWKSLDPEEILYESYLYYPIYAGGRDLVQGVKLEFPIAVEGTIYVGIKQLDQRIFIGMDKNNDSQSKNFYKVGGKWNTSSYKGSLFIRPEFGITNQFPVSVQTIKEELEFKMYPNPSNSVVNLQMEGYENRVVLRSILGVEVRNFIADQYLSLDVSYLPNGLYLIEVTDMETGQSSVKKLLIQH